MDSVETRLDRIEDALRRLEVLLETRLLPECKRMGGHISFVEGIYEKLRRPLSALRGLRDDLGPSPTKLSGTPRVEEVD